MSPFELTEYARCSMPLVSIAGKEHFDQFTEV
jgi:hypothetical protein